MVSRLIGAIVLLLAAASISSLLGQGIADTPENRRKEAQRYLETTPPKALFADLAEKSAGNLPPDQREAFKEMLTSKLDIDAVTKAMVDAMVKHFTADELKALADFYGSPIGKSAMSKFGEYMADIMPTIQAEMLKAQVKASQSATK